MRLRKLKERCKELLTILSSLDNKVLDADMDGDESLDCQSIRMFVLTAEAARKVAGIFIQAGFSMKVKKVYTTDTSLRATFKLGENWTAHVDQYRPRTCKLITKKRWVEATPAQPAVEALPRREEEYEVLECSDGKNVTQKEKVTT